MNLIKKNKNPVGEGETSCLSLEDGEWEIAFIEGTVKYGPNLEPFDLTT